MNLRLNTDKTGEGSPYRKAVACLERRSYGNRDEEFDYDEYEFHALLQEDRYDIDYLDFLPLVEASLTFYHGKRRPFTEQARRHYKKLGLEVDWKIQRKRPFVSKAEPPPDSDSD